MALEEETITSNIQFDLSAALKLVINNLLISNGKAIDKKSYMNSQVGASTEEDVNYICKFGIIVIMISFLNIIIDLIPNLFETEENSEPKMYITFRGYKKGKIQKLGIWKKMKSLFFTTKQYENIEVIADVPSDGFIRNLEVLCDSEISPSNFHSTNFQNV